MVVFKSIGRADASAVSQIPRRARHIRFYDARET